MRVLLSVAYDGSGYYGWQRQKDFITVQQRLEEALSSLLRREVSVRGASRTDTGVHALSQGVLLDEEMSIPLTSLPKAINSYLPSDIVVNGAREVSDDFHPQYSVIDKTYIYKIENAPYRNPLLYRYTDYIWYPMDIDAMNRACKYFIGEHDFAAFCASGSTAKTTVRTIYALSVERNDNIISIKITGSGFLYNMVRIIAGTLSEVGRGRLAPEKICDIIESRDRSKAGKTMSPNGLTLVEVNYNE
jgi:tRNA pseudouridine38-40 synthase